MKKLKTVFCGTPDFSVPTLDALKNNPLIDLMAVISMPDRPAGRGQSIQSPAVIEYSKQNKINYFQTENINKDEAILNFFKRENIDLIVVLAFAQFLGNKILNTPSLGCFNIHTSLLPKYRGAAPIQYALLNGDKKTGVTIQKMVKEMDAGDVVHSHLVDIYDYENGGMLYNKLKYLAATSIYEFIDLIYQNKITPIKQDPTQVTFAPTLDKEMGHLKFKTSTYEQIVNQIRGLDPWPGTYCFFDNKRVKIFAVTTGTSQIEAGKIKLTKNTLEIGCLNKSISIEELQIEGKKRTNIKDFLLGIKEIKEVT